MIIVHPVSPRMRPACLGSNALWVVLVFSQVADLNRISLTHAVAPSVTEQDDTEMRF